MTWKRTEVALDSLLPGTLRELKFDGSRVVLARVGPLVFAVDGLCTHMGGPLGKGSLSGRRLTCPLHGTVFDVGTGAVLADPFGRVPPSGAVRPVRVYPTRVAEGLIEVDLP
jgi:nitrite reductase/ring-hydroxylating ferredoxin subunit